MNATDRLLAWAAATLFAATVAAFVVLDVVLPAFRAASVALAFAGAVPPTSGQ